MENTNLCVTMGNELIRAAHNLSLMEKRVLMLAVSKLDSRQASSQQNTVVKLTVLDFVKEFGIDQSSAYREVRKAVRGVRKRYIRFWEHGKNGALYDIDVSWTTKAKYAENEGWIELSLNGDLNPQFFELKSHFTSYTLSRAGALRSLYAWRLFELLMQFKRTGFLKIELDEFHHSMESSNSYRKDFGATRRKIIEPAVKEIIKKDGLKVTWKAIKTGRKVTSLEFKFPVEQQHELFKVDKPFIDKHARPGESYEQAEKRLKEEVRSKNKDQA